jgi:hypothetical protein
VTCEELEELVGALALNAALSEEVAAAREHLHTCARAHESVRELTATAALLALAAEPVEPPARLRESILAAARADRADADAPVVPPADAPPDTVVEVRPRSLRPRPAPPAPAPPPPPANVTPIRRERPGFFSRALPGWLAAAAVLVVAAGLGLWNLQLRQDVDDREAALADQRRALQAMVRAGEGQIVELKGPPDGNGARGVALVSNKGGTSVLLTGLGRPTGGQVYQLWALRGDVPIDLGEASVFVPNEDGWVQVSLPDVNLQKGEKLAVTVEPHHVPQPTGPIVLDGALASALPRLLSLIQ